MFGYIIFSVVAGVLIGLTIAAWLNRATAAPAMPSTTPSAIGVDIAGNNNGPKLDPHFARLLKQGGIEL